MIYENNQMYKNKIISDDYDNVVIGSEICPIHLLSQKIDCFIKALSAQQRKIRFVTPIIPQKYIDEIYNKILILPEQTKVTFNDYGLLYKCKKLICDGKITPVLGRIITHSLIDCPWHLDIIKRERQCYDNLTRQNMNFNTKIDFMNEWSIKEIEVNNCPQKSIDYFHTKGISITQYSDYNLLSVSRTCFHLKLTNGKTEYCVNNNECLSPIYNLEMTDYYSNKWKLLVENQVSVIDWSDTIVLGTTLFIKSKSINNNIDFLII